MLALLNVDKEYAKAYAAETLFAYLWAVAYASIIVGFGLAMLFFSVELGLVDAEFPAFAIAGVDFPQRGSRIVFAMAFLGAYLSGLQHIYRRYAANDLSPTLYYGLAMRIILAAIVAVIIYNAYTALAGTSESDSGITANIWPALAFLIGIFPQRGLRWMSDRTPMLSQAGDPAVRPAPLEMIEGVEAHDVLRLEELGIDNCYDLATADFIPVLLKTPYSARQLIDWILQAKLCVYLATASKSCGGSASGPSWTSMPSGRRKSSTFPSRPASRRQCSRAPATPCGPIRNCTGCVKSGSGSGCSGGGRNRPSLRSALLQTPPVACLDDGYLREIEVPAQRR